MANLITEAFTQQYKDNITMLYQQLGSKLRGTVRETPVTGKQHFFERLGATAAVRRTTRHGDTPLVNSPHSRRMVTMANYEWADLIDQFDKVRMLISPESEYARNAAMALGRAYDDAVITAFSADALAGETGGTTVTFAADWPATRSATDGDRSFVAAAFTTANVLTLKQELDDNDVPAEDRYILVPPFAITQLLSQSTTPNAASSDYNSIRAIVRGELDTWAGFKWITTTRLANVGTDTTQKYCFAWHRDSMGIAIGKDITGRIDERIDKSYSAQVYACMIMDATRIQGEGVVRFTVDSDN